MWCAWRCKNLCERVWRGGRWTRMRMDCVPRSRGGRMLGEREEGPFFGLGSRVRDERGWRMSLRIVWCQRRCERCSSRVVRRAKRTESRERYVRLVESRGREGLQWEWVFASEWSIGDGLEMSLVFLPDQETPSLPCFEQESRTTKSEVG